MKQKTAIIVTCLLCLSTLFVAALTVNAAIPTEVDGQITDSTTPTPTPTPQPSKSGSIDPVYYVIAAIFTAIVLAAVISALRRKNQK
jgi:amino acid transporter